MILDDGWPSRSSVEAVWRQVIAGDSTRESVHDWSVRWVEGNTVLDPTGDPMVLTGLQYLHGLDMTGAQPFFMVGLVPTWSLTTRWPRV